MTLIIAPWKMSDFEGAGIDRPGIEHLGFKVESVETLKKELAALRENDPEMRERIIAEPSEGERRTALDRRLPTWAACDFDSGWSVCRYLRLRVREKIQRGFVRQCVANIILTKPGTVD